MNEFDRLAQERAQVMIDKIVEADKLRLKTEKKTVKKKTEPGLKKKAPAKKEG